VALGVAGILLALLVLCASWLAPGADPDATRARPASPAHAASPAPPSRGQTPP
jgi:hypothetical protein